MDPFTRDDLAQLAQTEGHTVLSLYMPTYRAGRDVQQNRIRFKNLLNVAAEKIKDAGSAGEKFEKQYKELEQWEADFNWWQHQSDGLAVFLDGEQIRKWRIPMDVPTICSCAENFEVRPLCDLIQNDGQFYILAVSQNDVRLLLGSKTSVGEVNPEDLPKDLRSALNVDEYVSSLQHHATATRGDAAMFHGHGGSDLDVKKQDEILQYFRIINKALKNYFGSEKRPLIFAGVDYLFPIFREACDYKYMLEKSIEGNPEHLSADQLHEKAWPLVEPRFDAAQKRALEDFGKAANEGKGIDDLDSIVDAATQGQIETLLVTRGNIQMLNPDLDAAKLSKAVAATIRHGGQVLSVDSDALTRSIAAILRFSVLEGTAK